MGLPPIQIAIANLIYRGLLHKQIAGELNCGERKAQYHREKLYALLGATNIQTFVHAWYWHSANPEMALEKLFNKQLASRLKIDKSQKQ